MASYDIADLPCCREILDILGRVDPGEVVPGMKAALEKARDHYGGVHLARMMGDLGYHEFIDPLIGCMSRDAGDFISEEAMTALAKIGTEAEEAVMNRWESLDSSQRIYGYGVMKRIGNRERAVSFLQDRFSEVRSRPADLEGWCVTAEAVPDRRLVEILEGELHRKLVAVDESYATLCSLLNLQRSGLEEVRQRIGEHRARMGFKSLDEMTVEDIMDDTSHMELLCESCGDTNHFEVPVILISPEHPKEEPCLGGDLACPSCGALGPFKPTAMGMMALVAETLKINMAADSGVEYSGPLQLVTSSLHDGRVVAPSTASRISSGSATSTFTAGPGGSLRAASRNAWRSSRSASRPPRAWPGYGWRAAIPRALFDFSPVPGALALDGASTGSGAIRPRILPSRSSTCTTRSLDSCENQCCPGPVSSPRRPGSARSVVMIPVRAEAAGSTRNAVARARYE